mgnify:CR=1 FL=1
MQRYEITGMSCAACAGHVEKAVAAVPGVASVTVSLLTNSMQVDYTPDADPDATAKRILRAVDAAGYGASPATAESESAELEDTETPRLKKRLIASLCFLVPLMYVSMGHMIGLPLGSVFHGGGWHAILYAGTQLALTLPVCWINRAFFISGWKGVKTRAPGMDTLVALGAGASLAYGLFARAQSIYLVAGGVVIAVAMIAMPLSFMNVIDLGQAAVFIMIAAIVLCVGAMAISLVYGQAGSRVFKNMQTSDRLHVDDDRYWKFGVFYCNPDDASLFLPERFGVGWTLNWARPAVWAIVAGGFVVTAAFVVAVMLLF